MQNQCNINAKTEDNHYEYDEILWNLMKSLVETKSQFDNDKGKEYKNELMSLQHQLLEASAWINQTITE